MTLQSDSRDAPPERSHRYLPVPGPSDAAVGARLEAALRGAGVTVEDLVKAAGEARAEIVREEFGEGRGSE